VLVTVALPWCQVPHLGKRFDQRRVVGCGIVSRLEKVHS
jgi:hypothetical protein